MKLRNIEFKNVFSSSGARGFFGEGYWYHKLLKPIGLTYNNSTFISKTTTLNPKIGNMPLKKDGISPKELKPSCIKVNWSKGSVLNSVGLSGPGAKALFESEKLQERTEPFVISFMPIENKINKIWFAGISENIVEEVYEFSDLLNLQEFKAPIALEINLSCPNVKVDLNKINLIKTIVSSTQHTFASITMPIILNISAEWDVNVIKEISELDRVDAISVANTIPWGRCADRINWKEIWGTETSPLAHLGGGGLSGKPLLPLTLDWIKNAKLAGITKPIIAGGGIMSCEDARLVIEAGASAIKLGTIGMLYPWRVQKVIDYANLLLG